MPVSPRRAVLMPVRPRPALKMTVSRARVIMRVVPGAAAAKASADAAGLRAVEAAASAVAAQASEDDVAANAAAAQAAQAVAELAESRAETAETNAETAQAAAELAAGKAAASEAAAAASAGDAQTAGTNAEAAESNAAGSAAAAAGSASAANLSAIAADTSADAAAASAMSIDTGFLLDRANHSGSQPLSTISDAGSAAAADTGDFATAAQGATADSAVQPGDLGNSAGLDVGSTAGTVAAGNDSRITGAAQKSNNLSDLGNAATAFSNIKQAATTSGTGVVEKALASEIAAAAADKFPDAAGVLSAMAFATITAGASPAMDHALGVNQKITHSANATFGAPSNAKPGWPLNIWIVPGAFTSAWSAVYKFDGAAPSITAEGIACFVCLDSSNFVYLGFRKKA